MKRSLLISSLIITAAISAACSNMGNQPQRPGHSGNREAMRQAAITACENKAEGTAVTLTTPRGVIDATCMKSPKSGTLEAIPNQRIEHMQAMEQACAGKKSGDSVTINNPRNPSQTMSATCETRNGKLMPNFKPPRNGLMQKEPPQ